MLIRAERAEDFDGIDDLVRAAFDNPDEDEVRLVHAIRRGAGYLPDLALVAELDGVVVGHVMISHAVLVPGDGGDRGGGQSGSQRVATLSPLAVAPSHQRQGIGSALVREAVALAEQHGEPLVVLEGSPAYYGRFGFEPAAAYGIQMDVPSWAPPEAAQVLRQSRYRPAVRGRFVFPALDEILGPGGH